MHQPRPYRIWCKEVVNVTKTVWVNESGATETAEAQAQKEETPVAQQKNDNRPHRHARRHPGLAR